MNWMLSFFICVSFSLHAEIIEIDKIDAVRPYITSQEDLVLFDIDDTLITNPFSLGTPAWRSWVKPKLPKTEGFVLYDGLTLFIAQNAPYKAVEESTPSLIHDLQSQNISVFAFTARGRSQWYTTDIEGVDLFTHQQLKDVGINFKNSFIPDALQLLEPTYFYNGIIFAQHIKKGDLLKHIFKDLHYNPHCIIFVDDKLEQVQSVEAALKDLKIPFIGFWYRHTENLDFNPDVATIQLQHLLFNHLQLSDKEALDLLPAPSLKEIFEKTDLNQLKPSFN